MPDVKMAIYKNRRGKYTSIYLWGYSNLAVCRIDYIFATTWNYDLIDIKPIEVQIKDV